MKRRTKKRRPIKMDDLAELAGVSKSTVSRALSDNPLVSKKTRDRIKQLAKEHNYRLNVNARNFFLKETLTIAVLMPSANNADWRILDPFFLELLGNIADALNEAGHELLLAKTSGQSVNWIEEYTKLQRCDGMILIGQGSEHDKINHLWETFDAFVVWGAKLPGQKYCSVGSDNFNGGKMAAEYLLSLGRKRLAFLGDRELPEVMLRFKGYLAALKQAGIEPDEQLELSTPFESDAAFTATVRLIESGASFDSIVAASDVLAMSAIRALKQYDLEVPDDISIIGYDDIMLSSYYNPALTTVRQNCAEGGHQMVKNLLRILDGEEPVSVLLPTELVIRSSCSGPPTRKKSR
ncbi:MAG: LacI family transcriptional regulator [Alphaproteobacteria bacterium]|nr:MAG: LacI family transcriptional regulator [Alphaproteobacteria bacterium]